MSKFAKRSSVIFGLMITISLILKYDSVAFGNEYKDFQFLAEKCAGFDSVNDIVQAYMLAKRRSVVGVNTSIDPRVNASVRDLDHSRKLLRQIVTDRPKAKSPYKEMPDELLLFRFKDLQRLIQDPEILETVLLKLGIANEENILERNEQFLTWSKIIIEVDLIASRRYETHFLTERDFTIMAFLEGFDIQKFEKLFRFDSRSPETIRQQKGFYPRNDLTSILEHSHRTSLGGSFISTSTLMGNERLLTVEPVMNSANTIYDYTPTLLNVLYSHNFTGNAFGLKVYEYEIVNTEGIRPKEHAMIAEEKEV